MDAGIDAFTTSRLEADAASLSAALDAMPAVASRDAQRYALRLQFAVARLNELQRQALARSGPFAEARVQIAATILETHLTTAAEFVSRTMISKRRAPVRRTVHSAVEEAVSLVDGVRLAA